MSFRPISWCYLVLVIVLGSSAAVAEDQSYKVLKFGHTIADFIKFKPDMQPFSDAFSICSWVRKLTTGGDRNWFSYAASESLTNEIRMRDDGSFNRILNGYDANVGSEAGIFPGVWYHYCICWSLSSREAILYHNGRRTGSIMPTPAGRKLAANGYIVLGQDQDSYGGKFQSHQSFGGELYKLNVFTKKLNSSEVNEMYSAGRCSDIEKKQDATRQLKWETIMLQPRTGNVNAIVDMCTLAQRLRVAEEELAKTNSKLETTEADLNESKSDSEGLSIQLNRTVINLDEKAIELNETLAELRLTKAALEEAMEDIEGMKMAISGKNCFKAANSSQWDMLYSRSYFNTVLTEAKLEILKKDWKKLEYFKGMTITDGLIEFLKTFHDGQDACNFENPRKTDQ